MRIISGEHRGKKLATLDGNNTRPTLDRVKEALFNILQFELIDASVLDLFAGSGSLGIEALSRGANFAIFGDNLPDAVEIIKTNIESIQYTNKAKIINKDYQEILKQLIGKSFDIIFLDPPYKSNFAIKALQYIISNEIIKPNGTIIVETDDLKKVQEIQKIDNIKIVDTRRYGRVSLIFIRKE